MPQAPSDFSLILGYRGGQNSSISSETKRAKACLLALQWQNHICQIEMDLNLPL